MNIFGCVRIRDFYRPTLNALENEYSNKSFDICILLNDSPDSITYEHALTQLYVDKYSTST